MNDEAWTEHWIATQFSKHERMGEHAGQWWVYGSDEPGQELSGVTGYRGPSLGEDRARIIAAAPGMARTLLEIEWVGSPTDGYPDLDFVPDVLTDPDAVFRQWCPACFRGRDGGPHRTEEMAPLKGDCPIDASLTAIGLSDQASRNAARKKLKVILEREAIRRRGEVPRNEGP